MFILLVGCSTPTFQESAQSTVSNTQVVDLSPRVINSTAIFPTITPEYITTYTSTPTRTQTPTPSTTYTPTATSTMTHFPTLIYDVEYPFNPDYLSYAPLEEVQQAMLRLFVLYIWQEAEYYADYGLSQNTGLIGFPSAEHRDFWTSLTLPIFCRYFPYARLIQNPELTPKNYGSLDYTFIEAQTLVGVDCADVDISMFPTP